jgi:hypothetical protein
MGSIRHEVLATNQPPAELISEACLLSSSINSAVYVYQCSTGWGVTKKLTKTPSGALINMVDKSCGSDEFWNTGGC